MIALQGKRLIGVALLVAIAQIGFLYSMISGRAAILRDGEVVVLQVAPIDPRDLLRGDYVTLGYDISTLSLSLFEGDAPERGDAVHVALEPGEDGGPWRPVSARVGAPPQASAENVVVLSGTARSVWRDAANILYGVERFYVPEGEGRPIETGLGTRSFTMHVAVGSDGTGQIKAFYDEGTLLFAEPLY